MPDNIPQINNLKGEKFFGQAATRRHVSSFILSEVFYKQPVKIPERTNKLAGYTLILDGKYSETFAGRLYHHSAMSVIWRQAGISHSDYIDEEGCRLFKIEIQPSYLDKLNLFSTSPEYFSERGGMLVWNAKKLYQEVNKWQIGSDQVVEGIVLQMLGYSMRKQTEEKQPPLWLKRVINRLNEEFTENIKVETLASDAGIHPVHLASVFRHFYHENISEYVQKLRINYAEKLLLSDKTPICEIAYMTGFTDQSHFTRMFKRYVGTTPGMFRNRQH